MSPLKHSYQLLFLIFYDFPAGFGSDGRLDIQTWKLKYLYKRSKVQSCYRFDGKPLSDKSCTHGLPSMLDATVLQYLLLLIFVQKRVVMEDNKYKKLIERWWASKRVSLWGTFFMQLKYAIFPYIKYWWTGCGYFIYGQHYGQFRLYP